MGGATEHCQVSWVSLLSPHSSASTFYLFTWSSHCTTRQMEDLICSDLCFFNLFLQSMLINSGKSKNSESRWKMITAVCILIFWSDAIKRNAYCLYIAFFWLEKSLKKFIHIHACEVLNFFPNFYKYFWCLCKKTCTDQEFLLWSESHHMWYTVLAPVIFLLSW